MEADRRPASELWHVHGRYYDLRPFLAAHPGGEFVLRQCMGSDCTALVYSHHLNNKPFDVLAKHLVQPSDAEKTMRLEYGRQTELDYSFEPNGFYLTVRGRVARYFAETGVRHPNQAGTYTLVKLVISIFLFWATWIHMCIAPFCMPIAFANGYLRLVLTGIGHDAIHHNVTPQIPWLNDMLFHVFGLFSAMDSSRWHYEHVVLHHPHTKTESDPDEELPLLRLSARAPWASIHCVHVASQIILGILLTYANAILEFIIYIVERGFGNENLRRAEGKPKRTNPLNGLISLFILQLLPFFFNEYEQAWRSSLFACGMYGIILLHTCACLAAPAPLDRSTARVAASRASPLALPQSTCRTSSRRLRPCRSSLGSTGAHTSCTRPQTCTRGARWARSICRSSTTSFQIWPTRAKRRCATSSRRLPRSLACRTSTIARCFTLTAHTSTGWASWATGLWRRPPRPPPRALPQRRSNECFACVCVRECVFVCVCAPTTWRI